MNSAKHCVRLLKQWDMLCVVCGREFATLDCVTREHLTPRSMGGKHQSNVAPSHSVCNSLRGSNSLLHGAAIVESVLYKLALQGGTNSINAFLATPVPKRRITNKLTKKFVQLRYQ